MNFYQRWRELSDEYKCMYSVVAIICGEGMQFDLRRDGIMRLFPAYRKGDVPTYRPATKTELELLDRALAYDGVQIEAHSRHYRSSPYFECIVLHQATGVRRQVA